MNRDTNELPLIMAELEESADTIDIQQYVLTHVVVLFCVDAIFVNLSSEKLRTSQELSQSHLSLLSHTLDDLDELGEIMTEMLQTQEDVEVRYTPHLQK
jgi:autophagy-related protein 17